MLRIMKGFFREFETFLTHGNAIDLAVGVVLGAAFTQLTTALAEGIITPPIMLVLGRGSFAGLSFPIGGGAYLAAGALLQAALNFVLVALALFLLVKFFNTLAKRRREAEGRLSDNAQLAVLMEIRDQLRTRSQ